MGQCEDLDNQMKVDYGDDYLTNRSAFPLTSAALSTLSSFPGCKSYFNYDGLVTEFCGNSENLPSSVGGGKTCKDYDTDGSKAKAYCLAKEDPTDEEPRMRTSTSICNSTYLKDKYAETAEQFCRDYPKNSWCKCYNITNGVCDVSSWNMQNAAGCKDFIENLDNNQVFFKDGYDILRENAKCRPRVCDDSTRTYVPQGALDSCQSSYNMCEKDLNIRSMSNSDIVLACNRGMSPSELPVWWDSTIANYKRRKPPFDQYPWNKLPITQWPRKFRWGDPNVKYLTYAGGGSIISCCLCLIITLAVFTRRR